MTLTDILSMEYDEAFEWLAEHQFDYDLMPVSSFREKK